MNNKILIFFCFIVPVFISCVNRGGETSKPIPEDTICFKLYIESSGSMLGYDSNYTKGECKSAITTLLNRIPDEDRKESLFYIVNDNVYRNDKTLEDFITSKNNIFESDSGNKAFTDFACIFDTLLSHTKDNELSILVSDLTYSTKEMKDNNRERILHEVEDLMTVIFKKNKDKDILLIKMESDFNGDYYVYNRPNKGLFYKGNRPYYFVFVAKHDVMRKIFTNPKYKAFSNYGSLKGYKNSYMFAAPETSTPYYSVVLDKGYKKYSKSTTMSSCAEQDIKGQIHAIEKVIPGNGDSIHIPFNIDLSMISHEQQIDKTKYKIDSDPKSDYKICSIDPIEHNEATHRIVIHTTKNKFQNKDNIKISMPRTFPEWITESSMDDDRLFIKRNKIKDDDDKSFSEKTFALEQMCRGVYNAYYGNDANNIFEIQIKTKK